MIKAENNVDNTKTMAQRDPSTPQYNQNENFKQCPKV